MSSTFILRFAHLPLSIKKRWELNFSLVIYTSVCSSSGDHSPSEALCLAAEKPDLAQVKRLLRKGVDVDSRGGGCSNMTPLLCAALSGRKEVVQELLRHNACINATSDGGWTALMLASQHGHTNIVRLVEKPKPVARLESGLFYTNRTSRSKIIIYWNW